MKIDFENIFIHIIGVAFILSGTYEAIFTNMGFSFYLPLIGVGIVLLTSPIAKLGNLFLAWLEKKLGK